MTKASLSPQLFKDLECWSGHDLPHGSPALYQLSQPVGGIILVDSSIRTTAAPETSYLFNSLPAKRGFKIASLNVNSLMKHIDLRIFLADNPVDVLAVNESKFDDSIKIVSCTFLVTKLFVGTETGMVAVYVFILKLLLTL